MYVVDYQNTMHSNYYVIHHKYVEEQGQIAKYKLSQNSS